MKTVAVIPARYGSTRLPGKPILDICGKPLIQRVWDVVTHVHSLDEIIVATDDERIADLIGTWTDENGNEYVFGSDGSLYIRSSDGETEGAFSAVADAKEGLFFRIVVEGGSLEYGFELSDDGNTLDLASPGTDVIHTWTKK